MAGWARPEREPMGLHLILANALAATAGVAPSPDCSWARPGADPYRDDPVAVLADFALPEDTRARLRAMMQAHRPSDVVRITRDDISGDDGAYEDMRAMHSGHGRVCRGRVERSTWSASHVERALVYCVGDTCVMVPLACHNVALVTRRGKPAKEGRIDIEPAAGPPKVAPTPPASPSDAQDFLPWPPIDGLPPPVGSGGPVDGGSLWGGGPGEPVVGPPPDDDCCVVIGNPPGGEEPVGGPPPPAIPEAPAWTMLLAAWAWLLARRPLPARRRGA